jgi:PAS domain S-box-containing protein
VNPSTHPEAQPHTPGKWSRLAWLPIPLLLAAIVAARLAGLRGTYESQTLLLLLSFTFYTLVSLGTLYLIGRSFLSSGSPGLLLLECGVVFWCLSGTIGDFVSHGDANINVTIFNTGILLAGLCHLSGAILALSSKRALRAKPLWLGTACALALGALWWVAQAALSGWMPVFFIPGHGGTLVRYCVLISAIAMFVLSSGVLHASQRKALLPFTSWYALALLLLAVGLFGVMIQLSLGSAVNWLSRTAQWLGGLYLLFAAIASLRESKLPLLPPEKESHPAYYRYAVAVVLVLVVTAMRLVFLSALGTRAPFVTFYPVVILAALYGGWRTGLLATILSAIVVDYFWIEPAGQFTIVHTADWLGLLLFVLSGAIIAWGADAMQRARAGAAAAEAQALLAVERAEAAAALRQSEERYRMLFNTLMEGFCIIEVIFDSDNVPVDYRFLEINPAFEAQTGLKNAQGKLMSELAPEQEAHWFEIYGKVALTGEPARFENEANALNRWFEVYAYRVGRPEDRHVAIIFNDITIRRQAEEKIQRHVEDLQTKNRELERINRVMVGRELRMIELKKEINELCERDGLPLRYQVNAEEKQP